MSEIEVVRISGWERYGWLRHGFSRRGGGVSTVYGGKSLNLGWTKEDDPAAVAANRAAFLRYVAGEKAGKDGMRMVTFRQVHTDVVRVLRVEDGALEGRLETAEGKAVIEADGAITRVPGVLLAVGTADCVPVLVVDVEKRVVAAFHAGWRGTGKGIVGSGVSAMVAEYGSRVEDLVAAVGPAIGACCYAVGEAVREGFVSRFGYGEELFRVVGEGETAKLHVDLWEANRRQLVDAGVGEARIAVVGECTACSRDERGELRYFSHRGEGGVAGRMLGVVGVVAQG